MSSYPTYEEWKHNNLSISAAFPSSSYPTYEEWKPYAAAKYGKCSIRSYPTYEEWKLCSPSTSPSTSYVLILPMRNGNMPPSIYQARLDMVLILPMRNGNQYR